MAWLVFDLLIYLWLESHSLTVVKHKSSRSKRQTKQEEKLQMIVRNRTVRTVGVLGILINLNSGRKCSSLPTKISDLLSKLIVEMASLNQVSVFSFNVAGSDPLILTGEDAQLFGYSLELSGRAQLGLYVGDPLHQDATDVPGAVHQCR